MVGAERLVDPESLITIKMAFGLFQAWNFMAYWVRFWGEGDKSLLNEVIWLLQPQMVLLHLTAVCFDFRKKKKASRLIPSNKRKWIQGIVNKHDLHIRSQAQLGSQLGAGTVLIARTEGAANGLFTFSEWSKRPLCAENRRSILAILSLVIGIASTRLVWESVRDQKASSN